MEVPRLPVSVFLDNEWNDYYLNLFDYDSINEFENFDQTYFHDDFEERL